jgi:hypothetical protein
MVERKRRLVTAWSKEDVKTPRTLARERLSGPQAAKKLRRSPGAVAQKAMKLGIQFRSIRRKARYLRAELSGRDAPRPSAESYR